MFFPKSIGLSLHGNDLIISKASQKFLKSTSQSIVVDDFLIKDSLDLKLIMDAHGFQTMNTVLSWPRERAIVREIELPGSNIKELRESISYQLDSFVLFPEEEVYYDIHPSHSDEYGEKVFIFAVKKEELDGVIVKLEASNLKPDRVIISPLSYIPLVNNDKVAVIEKCEDRYTFNLYVDKSLVSTSLVRNKNLLKTKIIENKPDELKFLECGQEETIDVQSEDDANIEYWDSNKQSLGVALNGLTEILGRFNVLKVKTKVRIKAFAIMGILSILVLAFIFILPGIFRDKKVQSLQAIDAKLKKLRPRVMVSNRLREEIDSISEINDKINEVVQKNSRRIDVVAELTKALPNDTWVRNLLIKKDGFEIEGIGLSGSKVLTLLEYSPRFDSVSFTSSVVKDKSGKEKFKIKGGIK
ncbi:Tfp pilus assembly protein PilN [Candidatus Scalindua japonica]|uniref:Tfp pilus assembly protein PilN n=1 Tax=Candidatus Scalindua japonica TaxID=1284222 RepID=A0A286TUF0_9BACT|nr:PilN domain-containing protein [Candidatus Scalindua japonica]GAX59475.1 Tfp pilus assembly protein PilN [Candidatus Scalindua japonica]